MLFRSKAKLEDEINQGFEYYKGETQKSSTVIESAVEEIGDKLINIGVELGNFVNSIFGEGKK